MSAPLPLRATNLSQLYTFPPFIYILLISSPPPPSPLLSRACNHSTFVPFLPARHRVGRRSNSWSGPPLGDCTQQGRHDAGGLAYRLGLSGESSAKQGGGGSKRGSTDSTSSVCQIELLLSRSSSISSASRSTSVDPGGESSTLSAFEMRSQYIISGGFARGGDDQIALPTPRGSRGSCGSTCTSGSECTSYAESCDTSGCVNACLRLAIIATLASASFGVSVYRRATLAYTLAHACLSFDGLTCPYGTIVLPWRRSVGVGHDHGELTMHISMPRSSSPFTQSQICDCRIPWASPLWAAPLQQLLDSLV